MKDFYRLSSRVVAERKHSWTKTLNQDLVEDICNTEIATDVQRTQGKKRIILGYESKTIDHG